MASSVQVKSGADADSATITPDSNVASGNYGLVATRIGGTSTNSGVTSSRGTWTLVDRQTVDTSFVLELWFCEFTSSGADTITMGGGAIGRLLFQEFTGIASGASPVGFINKATSTGTALSAGSITTTGAAWVVTAMGLNAYPSVAPTPGSGFSLISNADVKIQMEYRDAATPGSYTGNATLPESNKWGAIVAGFQVAAVATNNQRLTLLGVG